jgi:hypothetical protein
MSPDEYAAQIADFLRRKGITRCPTACALPTQGTVSAADRAALRRYASLCEMRYEKRTRHPFAATVAAAATGPKARRAKTVCRAAE